MKLLDDILEIAKDDYLNKTGDSELAMHRNEASRTEFLRRFSERQLQCYKPAPDKDGGGMYAVSGKTPHKVGVVFSSEAQGLV